MKIGQLFSVWIRLAHLFSRGKDKTKNIDYEEIDKKSIFR
jgi:hypothetical protein